MCSLLKCLHDKGKSISLASPIYLTGGQNVLPVFFELFDQSYGMAENCVKTCRERVLLEFD